MADTAALNKLKYPIRANTSGYIVDANGDCLLKPQDITPEQAKEIAALLNATATPPADAALASDAANDAECWRQLVAAHKFNNNPAVGFAINRAKEKAAMLAASKGRKE